MRSGIVLGARHFGLAVLLLSLATCRDDKREDVPARRVDDPRIAPSPPSPVPIAHSKKVFECEKGWRTCFVFDVRQPFRHFSDCVTDTLGKPSAGCFEREVAYCFQGPNELFCYPTKDECDHDVNGMRNGTMVTLADMKPLSDCIERRPDEF